MNPEVKKHYPKVSFGTIILVFLLPFFVIKCGDMKIASLSGVELITGTEVGGSDMMGGLGDSDTESKKVKPNFLAILSLLCAITGLILAFTKVRKVKLISLIISVIGLLSLIIMYIAARSGVGDVGGGMIKLVLGIGYYIAVLLFLGNSIFFGKGLQEDDDPIPDDSLIDTVLK